MNENTTLNQPSESPPSGLKFKDQLPAVILTAFMVIGAGAFMYRQSLSRQEAALAPLREQNDALRAQADENRHQIEATTQLIREAISKHEGELFKTDEEIQKMNGDRINALASAIAEKVEPTLPGPKTPEELAAAEDAQADKISTRIVDKMQPAFADLGQKQASAVSQANGTIARDAVQIQTLNQNLLQTQAAARDAIALSQQVSTLYFDSFKDHGVVVRLLALPTDLIQDAAGGNLINARDRKQAQQQIDQKMQEIEKRLGELQGSNPLAAN